MIKINSVIKESNKGVMEIRMHHFKCCGNSLTSCIGSSGRTKFPPLPPTGQIKVFRCGHIVFSVGPYSNEMEPFKVKKIKGIVTVHDLLLAPMISVWVSCSG